MLLGTNKFVFQELYQLNFRAYPGIGITRSGSKIKKIRTVNEKENTLHPSSCVKRQLQQISRRDEYDGIEPSVEYMAFQELSRIDEGTTLRIVTVSNFFFM